MICPGFRETAYGLIPCENEATGCGGKCINCCEFSREHFRNLRRVAEHFGSVGYRQQYEKEVESWITHCEDHHGVPKRKKQKTGNGLYQGAFAFTITKSPDDDLSEEDMIKAARKIMSQKSCPVKKYAWFLEYGDTEAKTHPHIHGMYETETQGRIEKKHWKRAWKIWDETHKLGKGFRGGYHRPVRSEENYTDYIKKDGGINEYFTE